MIFGWGRTTPLRSRPTTEEVSALALGPASFVGHLTTINLLGDLVAEKPDPDQT